MTSHDVLIVVGYVDQEREMRAAFTALDANNNGRILETELRQILGNLGDALNSQEVLSFRIETKSLMDLF